MDENKSKTVFAIVQILSLFSIEKEEIGVREVSKILGFSPGKIHRLLNSMDACGILEKNQNHKYRLGERIFEIGSLYPVHFKITKLVRPHAAELANMFNAGAQFAVLSKNKPYSAMILDRIINQQSSSTIQRVSFNVPLHSTALGKALLAFSEPEEQKKILQDMVFKKFTENTITDKNRFLAELNKVKKEGFALTQRESRPESLGIGAPILQNGKLVGAISLSDFSKRPNGNRIKKISAVLMDRASFISRQL